MGCEQRSSVDRKVQVELSCEHCSAWRFVAVFIEPKGASWETVSSEILVILKEPFLIYSGRNQDLAASQVPIWA